MILSGKREKVKGFLTLANKKSGPDLGPL